MLGEAPGKTEDATGLPFMGEAGRILRLLLQEVKPFFGVITNTVCCRPITWNSRGQFDENRAPTDAERELCFPHIEELIEHYKLQGVIAFGEIAAKTELKLPRVKMYHPAFIARMEYKLYTIKKEREVLNHFISRWD